MTVHVVGAGLAGLATAVHLASAGKHVTLYEATSQAGGRCRSYHDKTLNRVIDNGNHLMLSGNRSLFGYLEKIGAADSLVGPDQACFPFLDLETGERWTVEVEGEGWSSWLHDPTSAIPGAGLRSRLQGLRLAFAGENTTIKDCLGGTGVLWQRFWQPMATAVLNTPPEDASARLLRTALHESFAKGASFCRPMIAQTSLAASLVDPALDFLRQNGGDLAFSRLLRAVRLGKRANTLSFSSEDVMIEPGDHVILALPPAQIADLLPDIRAPSDAHAIVNAHFLLPVPERRPETSELLGLVGGQAEWLFLRDEIASVTVSAADALAEEPADVIAKKLWIDVAKALQQPFDPLPPFRVIKEKRATFAQTPAEIEKRPPTATRWPNLHLAGDWTDTGLPATIEGAVRSGERAARMVLPCPAGEKTR